MIKLGITDDHNGIRENLVEIFSDFDEVEVVWEANDGEVAVDYVESGIVPDIILMDISMRKMDGIEATRQIKEMDTHVKILMLSVLEDASNLQKALDAGADGYLLKGEKPGKIMEMIRNAAEDRLPLSPKMAKHALDALRKNPDRRRQPIEDFGLTPREVDVLKLLVKGKTYREIADILFISPLTVRSHMENIYRKLSASNKTEAVSLAIQNEWF